jgi:hypothetical protein
VQLSETIRLAFNIEKDVLDMAAKNKGATFCLNRINCRVKRSGFVIERKLQ